MNAIATFLPRSCRLRAAAVAAAVIAFMVGAAPARAGGRGTMLVLPASGRGVSATIIDRARELLVANLAAHEHGLVIDYDRPATFAAPNAEAAALLARVMEADVAISLDVSRDGTGQTVLDVVCRAAADARTTCHVREVTAAGPEHLPELMESVASRVADPTSPWPREAARAAGPRDSWRPFTFGVRAEVLVPMDAPVPDRTPLGGFGLLVAIDGGSVLADVGVERATGGDRGMTSASLGAYAPLGNEGALPYLGGSVRWVSQHLGGQGASGLQLRPTLGMLWGRRDVVKLRMEAGYFVDLFAERTLDRLIPGSNAPRWAHGATLTAGMTF